MNTNNKIINVNNIKNLEFDHIDKNDNNSKLTISDRLLLTQESFKKGKNGLINQTNKETPKRLEVYFIGEHTYFPGITDVYINFPREYNKDIYISANYEEDSGVKEHWMVYWYEKYGGGGIRVGNWKSTKVSDDYYECCIQWLLM